MWTPLLLAIGLASAAPCPDAAPIVEQLETLASQEAWAGATARLGAAKAALLCPGPTEANTLARYWLAVGSVALHHNEAEAAEVYYAAAARIAPTLWLDAYGPRARQHYDRAVSRAASTPDGLIRVHPEHVQYDGWLDGTGAIYPLKVASGLHLVKIDLSDGSNESFAEFVMVPPRETLRVATGLSEDIDQWVPVWLGGTARAPARSAPPPPRPPSPPPQAASPSPARAATPAPTPPVTSVDSAPPPPSSADATELPELTFTDYDWLKPARNKLDANPYAQTDFTAYTLELGEVELGLTHITAGVLPRTQASTSPVFWALGIQNVSAKTNPVRVGPLDLSLEGTYNRIPGESFQVGYSGLGGMLSLAPHPALGLHGGVMVHRLSTEGVPSLDAISPWILRATGNDLSEWQFDPNGLYEEPPSLQARTVQVRAALDLRFNRRDSLVLQGRALVNAQVTNDYNLDELGVPPILGVDTALEHAGPVPLQEAYIATLSYQMALNHLELRWGLGVSSQRAAWVLQAFEASWRFGGKTRWTEYKARQQWRQDATGRSQEAGR